MSGPDMPATYGEAKARRAILQREADMAAHALQAYPRGPSGLTPDHIRESPEYQRAKRAYWVAFARLQAFNRVFVKQYAKEYRADRANKK